MTKRDVFRNAIGGWIVGTFTGSICGLYFIAVPEENHDLIVFMLGQLSGFVGAVVSFNFGTTKSSADKNDTISKMAEGPVGSADDPLVVEGAPEGSEPVTTQPKPKGKVGG